MSKVIIFQGSPKKKGTTAALLAEVAKGAQAAGAEIVEYDLNNKELRGCQGCMSCRKPENTACVQNDYLKPMYDDLKDADAIVLGSPIYMGTVTAQAWTLIQRLYPAMGPDFAPRYPGKKFVTVITQGSPNAAEYTPAVAAVQGFLGNLGWTLVDHIAWGGAGGEAPEDLKQAAFAAGQKLVS
ncbi:MAG: flavodoxin family protein [Coriobacteriales bacterium]|jgi:multimeric flavodoxin WrbA|nr:flavodoxin family protein [Coriobacteriales bacterium]